MDKTESAGVAEGVDALTLNKVSSEKLDKVTNGVEATENECDIVDPWNVTSINDEGIDYDKLISMITFMFIFLTLFNSVLI